MAREWCPHCREHHTGSSEEALQDEIQNICKPIAEGEDYPQ